VRGPHCLVTKSVEQANAESGVCPPPGRVTAGPQENLDRRARNAGEGEVALMPQAQEVAEWIGREVVDASGDKIGTLDAIYLDAETDQPEWALVKTGLLGGSSPLVPLSGAVPEGDCIRVKFPKDQVKDAPSVKAEEELSQQEEARLYEHYGMEYSFVPSGSGLGEGGPEGAGPGAAGAAGAAAGSAGAAAARESDQREGAGSPAAAEARGPGQPQSTGPGQQSTGPGQPLSTGPDQPQGAGAAGAGAPGAGAAGGLAGAAAARASDEPGGAGSPRARGAPGSDQPQAAGAAGTGAPASDQAQGAGPASATSGAEGGAGQAAAAGTTAAAAETEGEDHDVRVRARRQPRERVRLKKYVITEHVTKTVPVQREEVRVEREPADADTPVGDADQTEMTLTEEEPVIESDKDD
jgi:Domain of unknown function (DUF2382)/PRC-barrel domain